MRPLKIKISITIDQDLLPRLRALAEADDRPLSQYINLLLRQHVENNIAQKGDPPYGGVLSRLL